MPKKITDPEKIPSLNRTIAEINKKYGADTIRYLGKDAKLDRISTGIPQVDTAIGGGLPLGRVVEFYGYPSAGKTLIALKTIAEAQKQGLACIYVDIEKVFDEEWATLLGVDVKKLTLLQVDKNQGENLFDILCSLITVQPGVIVFDSVAAIVMEKEMEESLHQQNIALVARLMSKGMRKLVALNKKTSIVFINQLRSTMAMYGKPTTPTGGMALGYYASIRVEVKQGEKLTIDGKKTSEVIGQTVQVKVDKNKTAMPYRQASFKFFYDGRFE